MNKVDDIVSGLTEEEKKLHRDLIKECKERETNLNQIFAKTKENLDKLVLLSIPEENYFKV